MYHSKETFTNPLSKAYNAKISTQNPYHKSTQTNPLIKFPYALKELGKQEPRLFNKNIAFRPTIEGKSCPVKFIQRPRYPDRAKVAQSLAP